MKKILLGFAATSLAASMALAGNGACGGPPTVITKTISLPENASVDVAMSDIASAQGQIADMVKAVQDAIATSTDASWPTAAQPAGPRPWLGVSTEEIGDDVRSLLPEEVVGGLIVRHVDADSPAAKAGLQPNDILLKLDDQILVTPDQLRRLIQLKKDGSSIGLTALRKGKELKTDAKLVMKETEEGDADVKIISLGGMQPDIQLQLPPEIKKLLESGGLGGAGGTGGTTVFSTSIVFRTQGGGKSSSFSTSRSSSGGAGISAQTVNGQTVVSYKGQEVFKGTTSGMVSTYSSNINGEELAAAFDGDKVLWENTSGAAAKLRK